jgi:transposase
MFSTHSSKSGTASLDRACCPASGRCPAIFSLPYRVAGTEPLGSGQHRIYGESTTEAGCPSCGVANRRPFPPAQRVRDALVRAVIGSGRSASETAAALGVSWWLVQRALNIAALTLPHVDKLAPRMLGIDEHRYRSVRFFRDPATKAWKR